MAKATTRQARRNSVRRRAQRKPVAWKPWIYGLAAVVVLGAFGALAVRAANHQTVEDPALATLARENAGSEVRALTGTNHTVYHSRAPLPTAQAPRADGKPTLVWFSGTWCEFCEKMEPFTHETAKNFSDRMVFVEKSVDDDRGAASRYGIRGTPTFVLIDASGRELTRFGFQSTRESFARAVESALSRVRT